MEFIANSLDDLKEISSEIILRSSSARLFAFYGEMGAGKTTLILNLLKVVGVSEGGSSPTYSIVNEYASENNGPVFHFDFYRIESIEEVYDIGYEDYLYSGSYCFMEWPERITELLPDDVVKVFIEEHENFRKIRMELPT